MGEARRRGTKQERIKAAINRLKRGLLAEYGERDEKIDRMLSEGMSLFLNRMSSEEWGKRRANIIKNLSLFSEPSTDYSDLSLANANAIRYKPDEIGWYLFLAEKALTDPFCIDVSQASRCLPYMAGIGSKSSFYEKIYGLEKKVDEVLGKYKSDPDGVLFEILVALAYSSLGWEVRFVDEEYKRKRPDIFVSLGNRSFYVECKKQSRRPQYGEDERNKFLRMWDLVKDVLLKNGQWLWFDFKFNEDIMGLNDDCLEKIILGNLPISDGMVSLQNDVAVDISVKEIDPFRVKRYLFDYKVKYNSPFLNKLLGGESVTPNSQVSLIGLMKSSYVSGCEVSALGQYIDDISWACGATREFCSEVSIDRKARDIKNLLSSAIKQVPSDTPSIIHIAVETLEGDDVEKRRTEKVMKSVPSFLTDKPIAEVRLHRFQPNMTLDKLWEFDETVQKFSSGIVNVNGLPEAVVLPSGIEMSDGDHWS